MLLLKTLMFKRLLTILSLSLKVWMLKLRKVLAILVESIRRLKAFLMLFVHLNVKGKKMVDIQLMSPDEELVQLYIRFAKLQKQIVRLNAELDNVRELIRSKGM